MTFDYNDSHDYVFKNHFKRIFLKWYNESIMKNQKYDILNLSVFPAMTTLHIPRYFFVRVIWMQDYKLYITKVYVIDFMLKLTSVCYLLGECVSIAIIKAVTSQLSIVVQQLPQS